MPSSQNSLIQFIKGKNYIYSTVLFNLLTLLVIVAIPNSPDHGAYLLLILNISAIFWLFKNKPTLLNKDNKILLIFLALLLCFFVIGAIWQPEGLENKRIGANLDRNLRWLLLLPLLFIFSNIRISWKTLSWAVSISGVVGLFIALYQVHYLGMVRASAFNNPIPFGEMMVALDLISWILMSHAIVKKERLLSYILLIGSLAAFYAALLAATRGAWGAYILMILIWFIFLFKSKQVDIKLIFNGQIWLRLIAMLVILFLVYQSDQFQDAVKRTSLEIEQLSQNEVSSSAGIRVYLWSKAWEMQKEYPLGVGTRNFKKGLKKIIEDGDDKKSVRIFGHSHNQFFNVLAENGWHTLIIFVMFQLYLIFYFYQKLSSHNEHEKIYSAMGLLLVLGFVVFQMTQVVFNHHATILFYILFLYLFYGQVNLKKLNPS